MPYNRREFIRQGSLLSGLAALPSFTTTNQSAPDPANRLVLLGTQGGPFIRSYKQTPSANLIVYNNIPIVIDTGFGVTFKLLDAGIALSSIRYIFITHHHSDHNLELGPLLYNSWIGGLKESVHVYAPAGLHQLLSAYWESNRYDIETRIRDEGRPDIRQLVVAHEITEGNVLSQQAIEVSALKNIHPPVTESFSFKFKFGDKVIVFSGDTAYCPGLIPFAANADILVHEVMNVAGVEEMVKRRPNATKLKASILSHHTSAEDVGKIASSAKVKTVVLTHFVPPDDQSLTEKIWRDAVSTTFSGHVVVGKDLMQLPL